MKKTCLGCLALCQERGYFTCELGYQIDNSQKITVSVGAGASLQQIRPKPMEECPKPKTNMQWVTAVRSRKKIEHNNHPAAHPPNLGRGMCLSMGRSIKTGSWSEP